MADALGCKLDRIRVIQGDTEACPWGFGNYSARSIIIGGSAAHLAATDVRDKMLTVAANMLEAAAERPRSRRGRISVRGAPERSLTLDEVAAEVYRNPHGPNMDGIEPGARGTAPLPDRQRLPPAREAGPLQRLPVLAERRRRVRGRGRPGDRLRRRFSASCMVHDAGTIVNPLLAEANLHGGIAQGIGAALYEQIAYDEAAQPLTATFMDYTIPTAVEVPDLELGHQETPTPFTPLGTKGVGESGVGAPLGALCSAVENALPELDIRLTELPLTPGRVWKAIREARTSARPARRRPSDAGKRVRIPRA